MNYAGLAVNLGIQGMVGGNELRAKCPLHRDNNPSFSMNLNTGAAICFVPGCFQGSFKYLVERVLGCSPYAAEEWIGHNGQSQSYSEVGTKFFKSLALFDAPSIITSTTIEQPWRVIYESLSNRTMPEWFLARGFSWETINHWDMRYAPGVDAVVIPVKWQGAMLGTITRQHHGTPKYLNSDFHKSEILFGEQKPNEREIILVEGPLDAVWLWQLGYNASSILGAIISEKQVELLAHRYSTVVLALDADAAGQKGTQNSARTLAKKYLRPLITTVQYPQGVKDPQDCTPEIFADIYAKRTRI